MPLSHLKPDLLKTYDKIIINWLNERNELLVQFEELLHILPSFHSESNISEDELNSFYQILTDYLSAGHFEVFEKIASTLENSSEHLVIDKSAIKTLIDSSEDMLDLTEKYRVEDVLEHFQLLQSELERIGEKLANRFDVEDQLVFKYLEITGRNDDFTELRKPITN